MIRLTTQSKSQAPEEREDKAGVMGTPSPDFSDWVAARAQPLVERWHADVEGRMGGHPVGVDQLLHRFFEQLVELLPGGLSPYRSQFEPLWRSCAELYGSVAAMRGLAAGEVIEEFQFLRESLIRHLFMDPPEVTKPALLLRDILRINRIVDRGVTYASVGHTDTLFFALFRGSGAPRGLDPERMQEVGAQLDSFAQDSRTLYKLLNENGR